MSSAGRLAYIDGIRGIGLLALLFAAQGMQVFFLVSGLCLAYPVLRDLGNARVRFDLARYAARRIVRILPVYYAAVILLAGVFLTAHYRIEDVTAANMLRQMAFLDRDAAFLNPWFWSVCVLVRWYVLFPLALWLWVRMPKAYIAVFVLLAIAQQTRAQSPDLAALPVFLCGIIAAELLVKHGVPRAVQRMLSFAPIAFAGTAAFSICLVYVPITQLLEARGIVPMLCALCGAAGGIAFWILAERVVFSDTARDRLSAAMEPIIRSLLVRLGIGDRMVLERPSTARTPALAEAS